MKYDPLILQIRNKIQSAGISIVPNIPAKDITVNVGFIKPE